jgi:hypothetical protein
MNLEMGLKNAVNYLSMAIAQDVECRFTVYFSERMLRFLPDQDLVTLRVDSNIWSKTGFVKATLVHT